MLESTMVHLNYWNVLIFYTKSYIEIYAEYFSVIQDITENILLSIQPSSIQLQWRHNGRDDVPNHQPHDC